MVLLSVARLSSTLQFQPTLYLSPFGNALASAITSNTNTSHLYSQGRTPRSSLHPVSPLSMSLRAWTCHGKNNREMVEKLSKAGIIKTAPVKEALNRVDRANYYPDDPNISYRDSPQSIGNGQTISAPHMHAHALEELVPTLIKMSHEIEHPPIQGNSIMSRLKSKNTQEVKEEDEELKVLDVGCGSGYLTAALGRLVDQNGPIAPLVKGKVFGIEVIPRLVEMSRTNVMRGDGDLIESGTVTIEKGDGWVGLPEHAPFHAIHVGAAAASFPSNLMMQLHPNGGVMVIPVGADGGVQNLFRIERLRQNDVFDKHDFEIRNLLNVRYVPLVRP